MMFRDAHTGTQVGTMLAAVALCSVGALASEPGFPAFLDEFSPLLGGTRGSTTFRLAPDGAIGIAAVEEDGVRIYRHVQQEGFSPGSLIEIDASLFADLRAQDVNGDGLDDIAMLLPEQSSAVMLLLQSQDGTLSHAPQSPIPTVLNPTGYSFGDVDADGYTDLIVVSSERPIIYRGLPGNLFSFPTLFGPPELEGADFVVTGTTDEDASDVFFYELDTRTVTRTVRGPGVAGHTIEEVFTLFGGLQVLEAVDFDGDGDDDIFGFGRDWIQLAEQTESGFVPRPMAVGRARTGSITAYAQDIDADGLVDGVIGTSEGTAIAFGSQDGEGNGGILPQRPIFVNSSAVRHAADANGDGLPDFFGGGLSSISVHYNDGVRFGRTVFRYDLGDDAYASGAVVAPFDDNGKPVVFVNNSDVQRIQRIVFDDEGLASGLGLLVASDEPDPSIPSFVNGDFGFADFNADGIPDFYRVRSQLTRFDYRLGVAPGEFGPSTEIALPFNRFGGSIILDVNADGADDIIVTSDTNSLSPVMLLGTPGGLVAPDPITIDLGDTIDYILSAGDYDNDGIDDAMFFTQQGIVIRYGAVQDALAEQVIFEPVSLGIDPSTTDHRGASGDFNGDGLDDIAYLSSISPQSGSGVVVYRSIPGRGFDPSPDFIPLVNGRSVRAVDLNQDGRLEIVAADASGYWVIGSDGSGHMRAVSRFFTMNEVVPDFADFNGDGALDIIVAEGEYLVINFLTSGFACPGDVAPDGRIDFFDLAIWLDDLGLGNRHGDFNADGSVNFFDLVILLDALNTVCPQMQAE